MSGARRSRIIPAMFGFQQRRRRRILAAPPPPGWEETLRPAVALYRALGAADRARLGGQARVFLAEKAFEGCSGLAVTEEMKWVIAVQACLLILRRPGSYYPRLSSILLYPEPFVAPLAWAGEDGTVHEEEGSATGSPGERGRWSSPGTRSGATPGAAGATSFSTSSPTSWTRRTGRPTAAPGSPIPASAGAGPS